MTVDSLAITGLGLASHLGSAIPAAAAVRAGIYRSHPLPGCEVHDPHSDEMVPLHGHCAETLTFGFEGSSRLLQLGVDAATDLHHSTPNITSFRLGLIIILSGYGLERAAARQLEMEGNDGEVAEVEAQDVERRAHLDGFIAQFLTRVPWLKPVKTILLFGEHAEITAAIRHAQDWLQDDSCNGCVLGAIDSTADPRRINFFLESGLLTTPGNPHGFTVGEAGAFLLLTNAPVSTPHGHLDGAWAAQDDPPDTALAQVLQNANAAAGQGSVGSVLLDHTGESWRFSTHGHAMARTAGKFPALSNAKSWLIPEHFGEIGSATAVVACILACRSFARNYARGTHVIIALSDHDGARAALLIRSPEGVSS